MVWRAAGTTQTRRNNKALQKSPRTRPGKMKKEDTDTGNNEKKSRSKKNKKRKKLW